MAIDLLSIKPHKVSRDLSGYITYIYGEPKTGKTTLATQMPNSLLLAFEKGYNALPGVIAYDVTSWTEMRQIYRELKKPEVKEVYKCILVDTVDLAADACQKYICNQQGIESMSDLPYGAAWKLFKKEFEEIFRSLTQIGYAVFFISHVKTEDVENETTKEKYRDIHPALSASARAIIENMADIYGFAYKTWDAENGCSVRLMLRSNDPHIACGCRFKYITPDIEFTYKALEKALNDAIEKEAKEHGNEFVTNEREAVVTITDYNYDALRAEFQQLASELMAKDANYYTPKIVSIVEKYLGKGKKVGDTTLEQAEFIYLINTEIKDELINK